MVWALSLSLAATQEIDVSFSSSGYLDVSVPRVPFHALWIGAWMTEVFSAGFPHSDIRGSMDICSSPRLFAACHVFLRLLVPRHPPCALISLTDTAAFARYSVIWSFSVLFAKPIPWIGFVIILQELTFLRYTIVYLWMSDGIVPVILGHPGSPECSLCFLSVCSFQGTGSACSLTAPYSHPWQEYTSCHASLPERYF